eukprot:jgi/Ulvmu1/577/UM001_0585.1
MIGEERSRSNKFERLSSGRSALPTRSDRSEPKGAPASATSAKPSSTDRKSVGERTRKSSGFGSPPPVKPSSRKPSGTVPPSPPVPAQATPRRPSSARTESPAKTPACSSTSANTGTVLRHEIIEAQNAQLQRRVKMLEQELEARTHVVFAAEGVLLDLRPLLESVCATDLDEHLESRMIATQHVARLKQACQASLATLASELKRAASIAPRSPSPPARPAPGSGSAGKAALGDAELHEIEQQAAQLAPALVRVSAALRVEALPSMRAMAPAAKQQLLADVADAAQASEDFAAVLLRRVAASADARRPAATGRSCAQRARRARASAAAQDVRAPWQAYPDSDAHALSRKMEGQLRSALNAAAERGGATEAHVSRALADVEQLLQRHAAEGRKEAAECAMSLTRLLHAASGVNDRPSEASVKQLVVAARLYAPALESGIQLLGADDFVSVVEHRDAQSRVARLKAELSQLWTSG